MFTSDTPANSTIREIREKGEKATSEELIDGAGRYPVCRILI